jgi:hypothetical protein
MPKEVKEKRLCCACNKPLVAIGTARQNGTLRHEDWENRKYHKKCYKDLPRIR